MNFIQFKVVMQQCNDRVKQPWWVDNETGGIAMETTFR